MFYEFLDQQLKREAATKVPLKAITAAILEAEQKYENFLSYGDRKERLSFVREEVEEICVKHASYNSISSEAVTSRVMEHLAADGDSIYKGISGTEVHAPKEIDPTKPIGGGGSDQPGDPRQQADQKNKYENQDVEEKQKEWHDREGSEHQDFNYGGRVPTDNSFKPPSITGEPGEPSFNPNDQSRADDGIEGVIVGGEAGGDTNPASHKKDKGNAKEISPLSKKETEGKKKSNFNIESMSPDKFERPKGEDHKVYPDVDWDGDDKCSCCDKPKGECSCPSDCDSCSCNSKTSVYKQANPAVLQEGQGIITSLWDNLDNLHPQQLLQQLDQARKELHALSAGDNEVYARFLDQLGRIAEDKLYDPAIDNNMRENFRQFVEEMQGTKNMIANGENMFPSGEDVGDSDPYEQEPSGNELPEGPSPEEERKFFSKYFAEIERVSKTFTIVSQER